MHAHTHTHTHTQHHFIAQAMTDIKKELKLGDMSVKANAISKLTYVSLVVSSMSGLNLTFVRKCITYM